MKKLLIHTEYIKLADALKFSGACETGGEAKAAVQDGLVTVNGLPCTMRGKKLREGDTFGFNNLSYEIGRN